MFIVTCVTTCVKGARGIHLLAAPDQEVCQPIRYKNTKTLSTAARRRG